jgi:hypothetical protein
MACRARHDQSGNRMASRAETKIEGANALDPNMESNNMRAILIDPKLCRITDIELADKSVTDMVDDMRRVIGAETLGHSVISDERDEIWCDDTILSRGEPCFGFKLGPKGRQVILAGKCLIVGHDRHGNSRPPYIPIEMIINDCDWLGEIVPAVDFIQHNEQINGRAFFKTSAIVTYSRTKRQ